MFCNAKLWKITYKKRRGNNNFCAMLHYKLYIDNIVQHRVRFYLLIYTIRGNNKTIALDVRHLKKEEPCPKDKVHSPT